MVSTLFIILWPDPDETFLPNRLLLHRTYRNDVDDHEIMMENFTKRYRELESHERTPFMHIDGISYAYIHFSNGLFFILAGILNYDAMLGIVFLRKFYEVLIRYLANDSELLDSDSIIDNINLVFELLDECMDFGIVQLTDYNLLQEYIKTETMLPDTEMHSSDSSDDDANSHRRTEKKKEKKKTKVTSTKNIANAQDVEEKSDQINSSVLKTFAQEVNWRPKGIYYAKNEIFIDMIEEVEFFYDLERQEIRRNLVNGKCEVKCFLSGMPKCKIGFSEPYLSGIERDENVKPMAPSSIIGVQNEDEDEEDFPESVPKSKFESKMDPKESEFGADKQSKTEAAQPVSQESNTVVEMRKRSKHKIPLENVQFHQCIQLGKIYEENIITFTPPDNAHTLLTYNVEQQKVRNKKPLFMVEPTYRIVRESKTLQILCVVTSSFKRRLTCPKLIVRIPLNPNIFQIDFNNEEAIKYKTELGEVSHKIDSSELVWALEKVPAKKPLKMMAELNLESANIDMDLIELYLNNKSGFLPSMLDSTELDEIDELDEFYGVNGATSSQSKKLIKNLKFRPFSNDVSASFSIPMLSYSGLKLTYLRVDEEQMRYTCFPWVRYLTKSDSSDVLQGFRRWSYRFKLGPRCFQIT